MENEQMDNTTKKSPNAPTPPPQPSPTEAPANEKALRLTYAALADVAEALADLVDTTEDVPEALAEPVLELCRDTAMRLKPLGEQYDRAIDEAHERLRKTVAPATAAPPETRHEIDVDDLAALLAKALVFAEPAFMDHEASRQPRPQVLRDRYLEELATKAAAMDDSESATASA